MATTPTGVVAKLQEDLDGDGKPEAIVVTMDEVRIDKQTIAHGFRRMDMEDGTAEVIDIDRRDNSREVAVSPEVIEDDLSIRLFTYDGNSIVASETAFFGNAPKIEGDGSLVAHFGNCGVSETVVYQLKKGRLVKISAKKEGTYDERECAACPFVYVVDAAGRYQFVGEILRNVVGRRAATRQSLALPATAVVDGQVRVRISERKPEVTYLFGVELGVGDARIPARVAGDSGSPVRMSASAPLVLRQGDDVEMVFDVGPVAAETPMALWAHGYYDRHASRGAGHEDRPNKAGFVVPCCTNRL